MNEDEKMPGDEFREAWVESLLTSVANPQDHTDRVARAMEQIHAEPDTLTWVALARRRSLSLRWGAIAVAASALLALFLLIDAGSSRTAMAAVTRSLNVASELMTRKYQLQVQYRGAADNVSQIDIDLFVRGHDRFTLRHPGLLPGTSFWLGTDSSEEWVVPPVGPVRKGNDMVLSRWLRSRGELDTPYLHLTSLLTRMARGYRLTSMPDREIELPDGKTELCQVIQAELETSDEANLPDTIELWSSRETGMAIRMVARWNLTEGDIGKESVVLTLQGDEPSLEDEWFTAEAHYEGQRVIVRVDALGQPSVQRP
jgi:hypothetical protein